MFPGELFNSVHFQQDRAPALYSAIVRQYLSATFPERWIGRGTNWNGAIPWPARSPDLTPLDFFSWGYLKDRVYKSKPVSVAELQNSIRAEIVNITEEMLHNVQEAVYVRLGHCETEFGRQFEHLL